MAIDKKFIHYKKIETFNKVKVSANENNNAYALGGVGSAVSGSPDINWDSVVFIKDANKVWTHGQFYEGITETGIEEGTYGPSSAVTGSNGVSINIPKIRVDKYGRVTSISNVSYKSVNTDTDTHYTTHLYAGSGTAANATTANGNTKLTITDDSTVRNSITIKGTGATTVSSDAAGNITINSTDTNTDTKTSSSNSTGKMYLIGATSQTSSGVTTYSNSNLYYTGSVGTLTLSDPGISRVIIGNISTPGASTDADGSNGAMIYAGGFQVRRDWSVLNFYSTDVLSYSSIQYGNSANNKINIDFYSRDSKSDNWTKQTPNINTSAATVTIGGNLNVSDYIKGNITLGTVNTSSGELPLIVNGKINPSLLPATTSSGGSSSTTENTTSWQAITLANSSSNWNSLDLLTGTTYYRLTSSGTYEKYNGYIFKRMLTTTELLSSSVSSYYIPNGTYYTTAPRIAISVIDGEGSSYRDKYVCISGKPTVSQVAVG